MNKCGEEKDFFGLLNKLRLEGQSYYFQDGSFGT